MPVNCVLIAQFSFVININASRNHLFMRMNHPFALWTLLPIIRPWAHRLPAISTRAVVITCDPVRSLVRWLFLRLESKIVVIGISHWNIAIHIINIHIIFGDIEDRSTINNKIYFSRLRLAEKLTVKNQVRFFVFQNIWIIIALDIKKGRYRRISVKKRLKCYRFKLAW